MNRVGSLVAAVALVGSIGASLAYVGNMLSKSDDVVIRIGHDSKEDSPLHQALLSFERQVEQESLGQVAIEIYPARQLGDVRETTELVRQGNLQMTVGASVLLTSVVPEFNVLDTFYLFDDLEHAHRALDSESVGGVLLDAMESKGFHGLGFMEVGFRSVTTSNRPISDLSDLAGLKMRAAGNPIQIDAWMAVGAHPTPLAWGEIFTSLQQGLIDSQESAIYSIYAERFFEAQGYLSLTEHIYTNYVLFANTAFWNGLDEEHRSIIDRAARDAILLQRRLAATQNTEIIEELARLGLEINQVDAVVRAEMNTRMNGEIRDKLRDRTGSELFDSIVSHIDFLRE